MDNTLGYEPGDVSSILAGGANQWRVNRAGPGTVLKTDGSLARLEFDSASPPPKHLISKIICGCNSVGRMPACQAECRRFEPDHPLQVLPR